MAKSYLPSGGGLTFKSVLRFVGPSPLDGRSVVDSLSDLNLDTFSGEEFEDVNSYYEGMLVVTKDTGKLYVLHGNKFKEVTPDLTDIINTLDGHLATLNTLNLDVREILETYVPNTRTVNGHALSSNIALTKADLGLGNVSNLAPSGYFTALFSDTTNAISITVGGTTKNITPATLTSSLGLKEFAFKSTIDFEDIEDAVASFKVKDVQYANSSLADNNGVVNLDNIVDTVYYSKQINITNDTFYLPVIKDIKPREGLSLYQNLSYNPESNVIGAKAAALASSNIGTTSRPVYFNADGIPTPIGFTVQSNVPANAKFTDTTYTGAPNVITVQNNVIGIHDSYTTSVMYSTNSLGTIQIPDIVNQTDIISVNRSGLHGIEIVGASAEDGAEYLELNISTGDEFLYISLEDLTPGIWTIQLHLSGTTSSGNQAFKISKLVYCIGRILAGKASEMLRVTGTENYSLKKFVFKSFGTLQWAITSGLQFLVNIPKVSYAEVVEVTVCNKGFYIPMQESTPTDSELVFTSPQLKEDSDFVPEIIVKYNITQ